MAQAPQFEDGLSKFYLLPAVNWNCLSKVAFPLDERNWLRVYAHEACGCWYLCFEACHMRGTNACLGWFLLLGTLGLTGCVERRFNIVTEPPGAMVLVNRQEIGASPITMPSILSEYYGAREFYILKDGYEPLLVRQPIPTPWYGYPGLDFIAEHLIPWTIVDERTFSYALQPSRIVTTDELLQNGTAARSRAVGLGIARPAPGPVPAPTTPPPAVGADPNLPPPPRNPNDLPPPSQLPNFSGIR